MLKKLEILSHPGWRTVIGGVLLHFVIGTLYNWGNIIAYVTSYLRIYDPSITYLHTMKVYPIALVTNGVTLLFSGWISERIGYRNCCFLGSFIFISATLLASCSTSFTEIVLTQGIMFGLGMGLTYTVPISSGVQWLPHRQGVVSGAIVAGFGCGSFIFGALSSHFANPHNISPVRTTDTNDYYFPADSEVSANVPYMYQSLAAIYFFIMIFASCLIAEPPTVKIPKEISPEISHETYNPVANNEVDSSENINSTIHLPSDDPVDKGQMDMLFSTIGWHLAWCLVLTSVGGLYLAVAFKVFAQRFFSSDTYLTTIATTSSLFNALGRIIWGLISDKYGPLPTLIFMSGIYSVIIWFYPLTAHFGRTVFAIWTFSIFFFEGSNFVVYIPLCIQYFGRKNATSNYALLFFVVPIFNLINIFVLSDLGIEFTTAATYAAVGVLIGCVSLLLLPLHYNCTTKTS